MIPFEYSHDSETDEEIVDVPFKGALLLDIPLLNKGSAFTEDERAELDLVGLLPSHVSSHEAQLARCYANYRQKTTDLDRYIFLAGVQDRNEVLFYRLLQAHITELLPIVYTPVVGQASQEYSHIYRRPRGLYVSYPFRDDMDRMLSNAPYRNVRAIVVTDGERILGLGDLGVGGLGIPIGKLALYTVCAGIHPATTLPIVLDVGTDNARLLEDPLYLGWRHSRIRGQQYDEFIERFVEGVLDRWPDVLLQWEDFSKANARRLLDRFRDRLLTFNDDIQGTGSVTLAGLMAAVELNGSRLREQRVVILGAGSAATGISDQLVLAMRDEGLGDGEAIGRIWLVDSHGLVHSGREGLENFKKRYARPAEEIRARESWSGTPPDLESVIREVRPTILVGTSATPGSFSEQAVRAMARHTDRPIIFPLSNPTSKSEAKPQDLFEWTEGRVLVATGSPFPDAVHNGRHFRIGQCNNVFVFPGVALGALASGATRIDDRMFVAAARAISALSPARIDRTAPLYPRLEEVRLVSRRVALAVGIEAQSSGLAPEVDREELEARIQRMMWEPRYARVRHRA
jgi:malate dehydrogenase (oxaloacetate-decarboxylating)